MQPFLADLVLQPARERTGPLWRKTLAEKASFISAQLAREGGFAGLSVRRDMLPRFPWNRSKQVSRGPRVPGHKALIDRGPL